jgi:hypothetical protein
VEKGVNALSRFVNILPDVGNQAEDNKKYTNEKNNKQFFSPHSF